jgi:phosphoglycerate dehydrogenase-like enzyme
MGVTGAGLDRLLEPALPGWRLVEWPGPGEVLLTLDSAWADGGEIPDEVQWIHLLSAGIGNFPLDLLHGRPLTTSKGASAPAIAEFTLAAMLAFEKQLPATWIHEPPAPRPMPSLGGLRGRTLGLVGVGAIGSEVAIRASAFGMTVVAFRRSGQPADLPGVEVVRSLVDVLRRSDHLVVAAPATAETYHLLDAAAFAETKPGLHLVNVARGTLVDHDALLAALDDGRVAMASLDVTDPEPLPAGHVLYTHPKVRISPHISWSAPSTLPAMIGIFTDNARRWQAGEPLANLVDVAAGY